MRFNKKARRKAKAAERVQSIEQFYRVTLGKGKGRDDLPYAQCDCGWKTLPSENLSALGQAAKDHVIETGHRFREHE